PVRPRGRARPRREDRRGRARARAVRSQGDRGVPRRRRSARVSDAAPLLEVTGLEVAYGAIRALRGVDFVVHAGEIVTLIGSNGAGKSTLLRAVSGMLRPAAGRIRFAGEDVAGRRSDRLVALGISHVPEGRRIFAELTVHENLQMGCYLRPAHEAAGLVRVLALFPRLKERLRQAAGTLSG